MAELSEAMTNIQMSDF